MTIKELKNILKQRNIEIYLIHSVSNEEYKPTLTEEEKEILIDEIEDKSNICFIGKDNEFNINFNNFYKYKEV